LIWYNAETSNLDLHLERGNHLNRGEVHKDLHRFILEPNPAANLVGEIKNHESKTESHIISRFGGDSMSFVSQIMRKASIVERSEVAPDEKVDKFEELVDEAGVIRDRMEASFARLSASEVESLGPGRRKEIAQLTETIMKLKSKRREFLGSRPAGEITVH